MTKAWIFLLPLLAACSHAPDVPEPRVVIREVPVPVAQPCVPEDLKDPPAYVDTDKALVGAADAAERLQLLYAGRAQRVARLHEIEPIIEACPKGKSK